MSLNHFPIKRGDTEPPFEVILKGGSPPTASDLSGVTDLKVSYRRDAGDAPVLTKNAEVVNPLGQGSGHVDRGRIRHTWEDGDTITLFGDPEDPTIEVVQLAAEVQGTRDGKRVTWPTEGKIAVRVERDVVEDGS